ncbi:MAG: hypothetical protein DCC75_00385 [Proteobacteria bacterium]|nr:MAG: hypothetical protein DCC75_00385 [Pseudomonadota bacterium]
MIAQEPSFSTCFLISALLHGLALGGLYGFDVFEGPRLLSLGGRTDISVELVSADGLLDARTGSKPQEFQADLKARIEEISFETMIQGASITQVNLVPKFKLHQKPAAERSKPKAEPSESLADIDSGAQQEINEHGATVEGRSGLAGGGAAGEGSGAPKLLSSPKPPYPIAARRAGFEGSVTLNILVSQDGSVAEANILNSSGRGDCDAAARKTIMERWRFEPARLNGFPIDWREKVVVNYNLR